MTFQPTTELVIFYLLWHATKRKLRYDGPIAPVLEAEAVAFLQAVGITDPAELLAAGVACRSIVCLPATSERAASIEWNYGGAWLPRYSLLPPSDMYAPHAMHFGPSDVWTWPGDPVPPPVPGMPLPQPPTESELAQPNAPVLFSYFRQGVRGPAAVTTLAQWHALVTAPPPWLLDLTNLLAVAGSDRYYRLESCLDSVAVGGVFTQVGRGMELQQPSGLAVLLLTLDQAQLPWHEAWRALLLDPHLEPQLEFLTTWPQANGLTAVVQVLPGMTAAESVRLVAEYLHSRPEFVGLRSAGFDKEVGPLWQKANVTADLHAYRRSAQRPAAH